MPKWDLQACAMKAAPSGNFSEQAFSECFRPSKGLCPTIRVFGFNQIQLVASVRPDFCDFCSSAGVTSKGATWDGYDLTGVPRGFRNVDPKGAYFLALELADVGAGREPRRRHINSPRMHSTGKGHSMKRTSMLRRGLSGLELVLIRRFQARCRKNWWPR